MAKHEESNFNTKYTKVIKVMKGESKMKRIFMFSSGMNKDHQKVLYGILSGLPEVVIYKKVILVETVDNQVAALFSTLDTAEELTGMVAWFPPLATDPVAEHVEETQPKHKTRRAQTGPLVECPTCHEKKSSWNMTKAGICKVCHMRALKAEKSQLKEMSQELSKTNERPQGAWTSGMPKSDGHHEEHLADRQSKPKEAIRLAGLRGRKLG